MEIKDLRLVVIGLCGAYAGSATAIEPMDFRVGVADVTPQLALQLGHNDNLYSTETDEKSSGILVINPSVKVSAERGDNAFSANYDLKVGFLENSNDDNYTDHALSAEAQLGLDARNSLNLSAGISKIHEDRGSNDSPIGNEPTNAVDLTLAATYLYGAEDAKANLEIKTSYLNHQFDNFPTLNNSRERENITLGGTFFYRVAPKTQALVELRHEDIDYFRNSDLNSTNQTYLVGVKWDATAKTSGTAKLGYSEKDYDKAAKKDQDRGSWEVTASWAPQSYSSFTLMTSQKFEEATGAEDAVDTTSLSLSWDHSWNDIVSTNVLVSRRDEDYKGESRKDTIDNLTLGANYEMRRWLSLDLSYTLTEADSNEAGQSYDKNLVMLSLLGSF